MKKKLMEPKNRKVPEGPILDIKMGPRVLVRTLLAQRKPFSGPIVEGKQVSTGWLKHIGPSEH